MSSLGRGRAIRARGEVPAQQQAGSLPPSRPGPPPPAPAAPRPIPKPRTTSALAALQKTEIDDVTRSLQAATISELGSCEAARGTREKSRGTCRQRPMEVVTRPPSLDNKQGKAGQLLALKANFFSFKSFTNWTLYQYRVDFQPDEECTVLRKGLLKPHKEMLGPYLFDGTVLYTLSPIGDRRDVFSERKVDDQPIRIIIKKTTDCLTGDYHYLQVLNIIMRKTIGALNLQLVGRDYYDPQGKVVLKGHNLEVWPGYITSIRQHEKEILMNVDVSPKVMRNETALHLLQECKDRSSSSWKEVFECAIIGATVLTRYNNKSYRIDDVDFDSTPLSTFNMKGNQISIRDYYRQKYCLNIRNGDQPLLVSRPKARDICGGRSNNVVLVPELCCLTGITDSMRSNFQLMKALADHTSIKPSDRVERLERGFMGRIYSTPAIRFLLGESECETGNGLPDLLQRHIRLDRVETTLSTEVHVQDDTSVQQLERHSSRTNSVPVRSQTRLPRGPVHPSRTQPLP